MTPYSHPTPARRRRLPLTATSLVGAAVVLLALAALLIPHTTRERGDGYLLVIDPLGTERRASLYEPLTTWLSQATPRTLRLRLAASPAALSAAEWKDIDVVFCPDGVALNLLPAAFKSVAAVRRPAPDDQRSRSVLVYSRAAGLQARPWLDASTRTLLGDSLSLAGCGVICPRGRRDEQAEPVWPSGLRCGPDPYDHGPVLHALRLGAGDYAVVREVTVRRFLADGLLDPLVWGVEELSPPLPDVVVLVTKRWPAARQQRCGRHLQGLGRRRPADRGEEAAILAGLGELGLAGFNLLPEPAMMQLRRRYDHCWPPSTL
jgi:hypothetical protein